MNELPIIEQVETLLSVHVGEAEAVHSRVIENCLNLSGSQLRSLVHELRTAGVPICSSSKGYYYANSSRELSRTVGHMTGRLHSISQAVNGMMSAFEEVE